jgi:hypothetical protein
LEYNRESFLHQSLCLAPYFLTTTTQLCASDLIKREKTAHPRTKRNPARVRKWKEVGIFSGTETGENV